MADTSKETVFRFAAPIVGTEDPREVWEPGRMTTKGCHSLWPPEIYPDPVIEAVQPPFDRGSWPDLY
ncbi:hypothetical protein ACFVTM_08915 [Arthrobacter sp. NPDC058130]|uniref:hypothetical protein n=1 Tax=Arthrobacter sp. NPDC058130 TaxID=3346353 RepID=UPI0036EC4862